MNRVILEGDIVGKKEIENGINFVIATDGSQKPNRSNRGDKLTVPINVTFFTDDDSINAYQIEDRVKTIGYVQSGKNKNGPGHSQYVIGTSIEYPPRPVKEFFDIDCDKRVGSYEDKNIVLLEGNIIEVYPYEKVTFFAIEAMAEDNRKKIVEVTDNSKPDLKIGQSVKIVGYLNRRKSNSSQKPGARPKLTVVSRDTYVC